jgi:molybdate transport system substrate-binding protein
VGVSAEINGSVSLGISEMSLPGRAVYGMSARWGGATGVHVRDILARLGIAESVKQKLRPYPSGGAVEAVARGEANSRVIGFSPILDVPGVELVGWLPPELQSYIVFTASIGSLARQVEGARALLTAFTSPAAVALFKAHGFEPASR